MDAKQFQCKYLINDRCLIAEQISGKEAKANQSACNVCSSHISPQQINNVTVSLALTSIKDDNKKVKEIINKYRDIIVKKVPQESIYRFQKIIEGNGVGSCLWRLLSDIGIKHLPTCKCLEFAETMNNWGIDGCKLHRAEIIKHMKESAKSYGWGDITIAVSKAILSGLAFRLSILDPYGSLLDEAIRLAELAKSIKTTEKKTKLIS